MLPASLLLALCQRSRPSGSGSSTSALMVFLFALNGGAVLMDLIRHEGLLTTLPMDGTEALLINALTRRIHTILQTVKRPAAGVYWFPYPNSNNNKVNNLY